MISTIAVFFLPAKNDADCGVFLIVFDESIEVIDVHLHLADLDVSAFLFLNR
jgi:hypothetical protein